jgi:hypothetical protein
MTMDHDIATSGFATLELREEPDSHQDREREGQGLPASPVPRLPVPRLPQRERLPNR